MPTDGDSVEPEPSEERGPRAALRGKQSSDEKRVSTPPSPSGEGSADDIVALKMKVTDCSVVLGRRGLGKTVLIRWIAGEIPYDLTVLDVADDLSSLKDLETRERKVDYHLVNPHDESEISGIILSAEKKGNQMVVLDEADRYDYYANDKNALSDFVNLGRHYQCGYIAAARRTANLAIDFMSNATYLFIFRHTNRKDLEYLLAEVDVDRETLRNLGDHEFIVCKNGEPLFIARLDLKPNDQALKERPKDEFKWT